MRNLLLLSILLFTAQSDAFQIRNSDGILMQFGGVVEMEFVDVEGSGGLPLFPSKIKRGIKQ